MKNYLQLVAMLLVFITNHSIAQCTLKSITEKLSKAKLNASFVQSKKIPALSHSLKSMGNLWLSKNAELVWQVKKPIKSTMVIKQGKIIQFNRKDLRLESAALNAPSGLATLFYRIANGNLAKLSEQFSLELHCKPTSWEVLLLPKEQQLSQFIKQLKLIGTEQIDSFSYIEKRGDETQVSLTHLQASLAPELARYLN